jgi:MFS transporter, putative metabolite:H+ symporter
MRAVRQPKRSSIALTVFVSALGYFVDIYDLLLFGIVRVPSLRALNVPESEMLAIGMRLLNFQMAGMLLGGILWGIIGDKRGRKSVLFGSILLYSVSNIANAFVLDTNMYCLLRLSAGIGLAGELGAAVTLVSEVMSAKNRGIGTTIVASVGILGAVFGSLIGDDFDWKVAFLVGGAMGLGLLVLRAALLESPMFKDLDTHENIPRGAFLKLFANSKIFFKYIRCILIGVPIWFVIGILVTFAPELAKEFGVHGEVTGSHAILWAYLGLSVGDLASGLFSQYFKSRRFSVLTFLFLTVIGFLIYLVARDYSSTQFYGLCVFLGFATGYWSVFVTIAAEQFGTNMRATAAITVPNFVRGAVVPMSMAFHFLRQSQGSLASLSIVGGVVLVLAFVSLFSMRETFGTDLNTIEAL